MDNKVDLNSSKNCECEVGKWPSFPECPHMAMAYVSYQQAERVYKCIDGLAAGTIFPDLDIPCKCYNNRPNFNKNCVTAQMMALSFALVDMNEYLDTHPCDSGALKLIEEYSERLKEVENKYICQCGPITARQAALLNEECGVNKWDWVSGPWPWENAWNRRV